MEARMTSTRFHPRWGPYELVVFDVRAPGAIERLLSERAAWGEDAVVELLDPDHAALIVRAGGAARMGDGRAA
jgi:hypothetical protein